MGANLRFWESVEKWEKIGQLHKQWMATPQLCPLLRSLTQQARLQLLVYFP